MCWLPALPEQGYLVESRRGGGGYLRIIKLELEENQLIADLLEGISNRLVSQGGRREFD